MNSGRSWTGLVEYGRRRGWQLLAAATSAVILFSALRGIARGYEPIGDNALIELRSRDVFTSHHPLLGTWSSASLSAGIDVNHPGPLLFDLVALPVRLFGNGAGIALAVAALHVSVVWLVGWCAARVGGPTAAVAAGAVTAALVWTLGSELLYDPWQPNVLVLPFWLVVCAAWAAAAGHLAAFPLAVGYGSFAMQTHLSYIVIVPVLLGYVAARLIVRHRRDGRLEQLRRPTIASLAVIAVLWAQPLWEQAFGPGRGNLSRVLTAGTGGGDGEQVESVRAGASLGIRMIGGVLAVPPFWGRPGYDSTIRGSWVDTADGRVLPTPGLPTLGVALFGLVVLGVLVALAWRFVGRRGDRHVAEGFGVAMALLAVAAITILITPLDPLGLSPHKVRWLWVAGAFLTLLLVLAAISWAGRERRPAVVAVVAAIAGLLLVTTLPTYRQFSGPVSQAEVEDTISDLRASLDRQLDEFDPDPVLFDPKGLAFAEPYTAPVMAELLENGVDLTVLDDSLARQLGPDRDSDPGDDDLADRSLVYVRVGEEAVTVPEGAVRIAFTDGATTDFTPTEVVDRAVAVFYVPGGALEHVAAVTSGDVAPEAGASGP